MRNPPKILLCPLDWGLGHASRCVPIIRALLERGCEVLLGTAGIQEAFYAKEFPDLAQVPAPPYNIRYPEHGWQMPLWLIREAPRLRRLVSAEQRWTENICAQHGITLVISDNRFGCFSRKVPSIYITHQVRIAFPKPFHIFEKLGEALHLRIQRQFKKVWIPDWQNEDNLAGRLSHSGIVDGLHQFIGPLTRFAPATALEKMANKDCDLLILLSGPEPQRSLIEGLTLNMLENRPERVILIQGRPGLTAPQSHLPNVKILPHASTDDLRAMILSSQMILCRSGYSTLMDLQVLGAKAVLVPTPGQTEQECLAADLRKKGTCGALKQSQLSWPNLRAEECHAHGFLDVRDSSTLLQDAIQTALNLNGTL